MLTTPELLARGLQLPPVKEPVYELGPHATCAMTGVPITHGYRVMDMVTDKTAEFLDPFGGHMSGYICDAAARCFRSANPRIGNPCARPFLGFEDVLYMPTLARNSVAGVPRIVAEAGIDLQRPCWADIVREVWPARAGQPALVMLTTDTKKRLWPRARVGPLGKRTPVLIYDMPTNISSLVYLDWGMMLVCLELVEHVYTLGFPKAAIRESLYSMTKAVEAIGFAGAAALERSLADWRGSPEFTMATLIAQKQEGDPVDD